MSTTESNKIYLGINSPVTRYGEQLRDGNVSGYSVSDGKVISIQEERISKRRYDGDVRKSIEYCLTNLKYNLDTQLHVAFSSALDRHWTIGEATKLLINEYGLAVKSLEIVDHHESHAWEAFALSPYDEAIVIVIDSMGNSISNKDGGEVWETHSYYIGRRSPAGQVTINILFRECDLEPGYGQLFRAATWYVGFPGYHHASKLMAIAGIGKNISIQNELLPPHTFIDDKLSMNIDLDPNEFFNPIRKWLLNGWGYDHPPRDESWYLSGHYLDKGRSSLRPDDIALALMVQNGYENFLIERLSKLISETGINNVCFGGGCALNCVANAKVFQKGITSNIYVGNAPSDTGQSLGNLLYLCNKYIGIDRNKFKLPYLGAASDFANAEINGAFLKANDRSLDVFIESIVNDLKNGKILAIMQSGSELGPRALGNRSIIASPSLDTCPEILNRLFRIKSREDYQPFAVAVQEENINLLVDNMPPSPFMSFAPIVNGKLGHTIQSVIHDDGTCRIQTVSKKSNELFYNILNLFYIKTGIPALINTSLNLRSEPIIETIDDAQSLWERAPDIDGIIVGSNYYLRN